MGDRKLTMQSSVGTLSLKFYGEQLVYTFGIDEQKSVVNGYSRQIKEYAEKLVANTQDGTNYKELIQQLNKELTTYVESIIAPIEEEFYGYIKKYDKSYAQVLCIKHNRDYNSDDVWEPSIEKPHYHLLMRKVDRKPIKVSMLLSNPKTSKRGLVEYRKELDDALFNNNGVETIGDFQKYTVYLTHETEEAERDGKAPYQVSEIISNMDIDEIELIRDGYKQVSRVYVKPKDIRQADSIAYELGTKLKSFEDWYNQLPFDYRKRNDMKTVRESYERGVDEALAYAKEITRVCVFIQGAENQGKSTTSALALEKIGIDPKYIFKVTEGTGKFDTLTVKHKAIIVDDTTSPSLLHLADSKPCKVYRRNKGNGVWVGDYFIVCSNLDFHKWSELCGVREENYKALYSRFNIILQDRQSILVAHRATRGDSLAFDIKEKFDKFVDKYKISLRGYKPVDGIAWYLNHFDIKQTYETFKYIITKCPVQAWEILHDNQYTLDALHRYVSYVEAEKIRTAIHHYYKIHADKVAEAKNTYCSIPLPPQEELFASLYGYDTTDIDKEFEELIYEQADYESNLEYNNA